LLDRITFIGILFKLFVDLALGIRC